ncbi:MAG: DUF6496 domain-containing protein [Acidobacteriota bacterium]
MPERQTVQKAKQDLRHGRAPSTAAGEFVREEIHHVRRGKHGARSTKQAIAIGLSKARRAGVPLRPPKRGASARTRKSAERAYETGQHRRKPRAPSRRRGRAVERALRREGHGAASPRSLARQAHRAAARRGHAARRAAARKAARTKGPAVRRAAARKAARTRARRRRR